MEVGRESAGTPSEDAEETAALLERVAKSATPEARIWCPSRHVSFGPRDVRAPGYTAAARAVREREYAVRERTMGGHPVAFTGDTVALVFAEPPRGESIDERYDRVASMVSSAIDRLGVSLECGAPPRAFCPGNYGLSASGKVVGLAQRVRSDVVAVGGIVIVSDDRPIATVLEEVYDALELPFDPDSVGSIERAGGRATPAEVCDVLETQFRRNHPDRTI